MRLGAAVMWGLVLALGAYPILRTAAYLMGPEPNPAEVVWTAHAGYFARAWICAYVGALGAIGAYAASAGREEAAISWATRAFVIAAGSLALQAIALP